MEVAQSILVNGSWSRGDNSREVTNPATGEVISLQAEAGKGEIHETLDAASGTLVEWQKSSPYERSDMLNRVSGLLLDRAEDIGETLALETGKLLKEAIGEIRLSADYFSWFAGEARRLEELVAVDGRPSGPQMVLQKPIGVAASLTPWNFPVSIQARKVAPALAAGCTVVARPSEQAPNSVVELFRCLVDAGLPDGTVNLLTGSAGDIVDPILDDPRVRIVSFTGSTRVGRMLYERSAGTMKRLALELGGSAPFIVFQDTEVEYAVEEAMLAKFRNCGQSCVAANCLYIEEGIYDDFVGELSERVGALRLGILFRKRPHSARSLIRRAVAPWKMSRIARRTRASSWFPLRRGYQRILISLPIASSLRRCWPHPIIVRWTLTSFTRRSSVRWSWWPVSRIREACSITWRATRSVSPDTFSRGTLARPRRLHPACTLE